MTSERVAKLRPVIRSCDFPGEALSKKTQNKGTNIELLNIYDSTAKGNKKQGRPHDNKMQLESDGLRIIATDR